MPNLLMCYMNDGRCVLITRAEVSAAIDYDRNPDQPVGKLRRFIVLYFTFSVLLELMFSWLVGEGTIQVCVSCDTLSISPTPERSQTQPIFASIHCVQRIVGVIRERLWPETTKIHWLRFPDHHRGPSRDHHRYDRHRNRPS